MTNLLNCLRPYQEERLLLAVSGGSDSLAMYCLAQQIFDEIFVVHIDHSWRESSTAEAEALQEWVDGTFHLERVSAEGEDGARRARLEVYRRLCDDHGYSGVMLAHHADDQAEVVFKRAVEGAGLVRLAGMRRERVVEGVRLVRPFLGVRRDELRQACTLPAVDDATNRDTRFYRARLREVIFPAIGKGVVRPLLQLAAEAEELAEYFDARMPKFEGGIADLRLLSRAERRHFLRGLKLSRQQIDNALDAMDKPNRQIGPYRIHLGRIYLTEDQ